MAEVTGVNVVDDNSETKAIHYVDELRVDANAPELAKSILTRKLKLWEHEREHRVFKRYDHSVDVEVKELIFGIDTDPRRIELLSSIARKFCPGIIIKQINRSELETGSVDQYEI